MSKKEKVEIEEDGSIKKTPIEQTENPTPNLDTLPGNEKKPPSMPEKTMVKEINPQTGSPAIPSRAPEIDPGNSLSVEKAGTSFEADKETVRDATDARAKANVAESQNTKPRPNEADASSDKGEASASIPIIGLIVALPPKNPETPHDELDSVHPQAHTIEADFPHGALAKRANLSSSVHPGHQDQSELNREIVAHLAGVSARGDATAELTTLSRRRGYIHKMQLVELVLRNTSMDTQQREKVLRQLAEIFSD